MPPQTREAPKRFRAAGAVRRDLREACPLERRDAPTEPKRTIGDTGHARRMIESHKPRRASANVRSAL